MSRKIGITGSTGVLGSLLKELFPTDAFNSFTGDITKQHDVDEWVSENSFDAIFHFAALVPVKEVEQDIIKAYHTNVTGTIYLLNAIKKHSPDTWMFYASSSHVYAPSNKPITESHPLEPHNVYGRTKMAADLLCQDAINYQGMKICIGRIFSFYHERQAESFLYPALKTRLSVHHPETPFELFGAKNIRDLSNAEGIVKTIHQLYTKKITGVLNIGSGQGISIEKFAEKIAGYPLRVIDKSEGEQNSLVADITKLNQLINTAL